MCQTEAYEDTHGLHVYLVSVYLFIAESPVHISFYSCASLQNWNYTVKQFIMVIATLLQRVIRKNC